MKSDLQKLQGNWKQVSWSSAAPDEVDELLGDAPCMEVVGCEFRVKSSVGSVVLMGKLSIDSSIDPKGIDWTDTTGPDAGKTFPAIYRLSDIEFEFCAADQNQPRPREFVSTDGYTVRRFRRLEGKMYED